MRAARSRVVANTGPAIPAMPDAGFEERYALVCQAVAEGIYEWDIERNLLSPSARLMEIFGFEGSGLGAADWNEIVHPEDFPIYRAALRDCFRGVTPRLDCEYRVRHGDGAYRWIEDRALPVRNEAGRAIRLVGAVTDVTARKAAEQALRDNQERYSLVSQAVAEGIYDWNVEENTLFVSPRLMEIFKFAGPGLSSEDWYALVHAADRESYRGALRDCFKGLSSRVACEYRIQVRSGEYRWVEDHGLPVRNAAGRAVRLVGAVSDITERKESERALHEALEQQTATAEVLQVINSSPGDLAPVFDAMLERAVRICEPAFGMMHTWDGTRLHRVALRGVSAELAEATREPVVPPPGAPTDRLIRGADVVCITDLTQDETIPRHAPVQLLARFGARSYVLVPLRKNQTLLGVVAVYRLEVRPFSDKEIALLQNFAAQAVIAMENARLLGELRERTGDLQESLEYQTATSDMLKVISRSTFDLQPVLATVGETAARLCDAEMAFVSHRDGEVFRFVTAVGATLETMADAIRLKETFLDHNPFVAGYQTITGRVLLEGRALQIADITADPDYKFPEAIQVAKIRTLLGVPLLREGEPIGTFSLARQRVEPFTERQIELVRTFADQAVIAIENTRLLNEQREALERQTATAEILRVISSSPTDVQPVFEAVVESAMRLSESAFAGLWWFDGQLLHLKAHRNLTTEGMEAFRSMWPMPPSPESLIGRAFIQRGVLNLEDAGADTGYAYSAVQSAVGYRSTLLVPLLRSGAPVGVVAVWRHDVAPYSDKHVDLLQTFADQAVIAVENVRLFNELSARTGDLEESLEYQTATSDVLKVISASTFDLQPVLDTLVETAARLCEADMSSMFRRVGDGYRGAADFGLPPAWREFIQKTIRENPDGVFTPGRGAIISRIAAEGGVVHVHDVAADPDYAMTEAVTLGGVRTAFGVPLLRQGEMVGAFTLGRQRVEPFTERQIELVRTFADQAVIAIENARLLTELNESLEHQRAIAELVQTINASPGNLQPVFDAMVEKAVHLCGAAGGVLRTFDGEAFHLVAASGDPRLLEQAKRLGPIRPTGSEGVVDRIGRGERTVHIEDVRATTFYRDMPDARERLDLWGVRTWLGVALHKDDVLLGAIIVSHQEVKPFSERQIALLQNFAAQAVIAMENARLLGELRERTGDLEESLEYQTATSDVLKVISASTFDLQPVLDTLVETAARLCTAEIAVLVRREGEVYRMAANFALAPEFVTLFRGRLLQPDRGTIFGRAVLEKSVVHVADITADPEYGLPETISVANIRTMLGVPLLREGEPIGALSLSRQRVEPFTERQIELVRTFADQAVIAIENARLLTELNESLEHQRAIAELVQTINSSPGNVQPVFDAMLEKAMRLCESAFGFLVLFEDGNFRSISKRNLPNAFAAFLESSHPVSPNGSIARIAAGGPLVQIADISADEITPVSNPGRRMLIDSGARSTIWVPLRKEGVTLGCFNIYREEVRPFNEKQIALLENFAAQAVIAMENARLLGELQQRTGDLEESLEYQTATSDVLQVISRSTFDLQPVLDTVVSTAARLCAADQAAIFRREGELYALAANFGFPAEYETNQRARGPVLPNPNSVTGRALAERAMVHVLDVAADPNYPPVPITLGKQRTSLGVPLLREGEPIGVLSIARQRVEPFTERQIELVRTFADQAVIAIENTRLLTETREALEQQTATAEVLEVINSSPGELDPVFEAMLERAGRLCEAQTSHLLRYQNGAFSRIASLGVSEDFDKILPLNIPVPHIITRDSIPYRMLASRAVVHVHDLHEDESIRAGAPAETMAMATGIRSLLFVPLLKEGDVVGCFVMHRLELRPFSDKQITLLESFAAQAVIAMDNARLLQEIRQTQAELRVTFDNMGDGVAMFDAELRLAAWNMNFQKILDLPDEFVTQRPTLPEYFQYMAGRGEYGSGELEAEIRRSVTIADHETRFERTRPDGRVIEVRRNAVPGGGSVLIIGDITERKRAEAEIHAARDAAEAALGELKTAQANLIQAEKMASLGQLTAGIAHEIKNPLNFVNNFAGLSVELLDELKAAAAPALAGLDDETRAEIDETVEMLTGNLEKIAEHGRRADGIVKSMLEHSRGATGDRREVDLNALVEESLNLAYHGARAQDQNFNITLEREFGAAIAPVELVPQDVTRVFLNLIGNGFYAANKRRTAAGDAKFKPILTVTTRELGDAVEVAVRDNGIGIGPELRDKLFQPFFTTKPTGEGTGLGLSISYDIVTQEHGGTITVDSKIGEFTVFTVRLPRERQAVNPRSRN